MKDENKLTNTAILVEDSQDMAMLLKSYLKELKIFKNIIISKDGKDAGKKMRLQEFDFYFIDENLPGNNGINLIKEISENNKGNTYKVVYSSASLEKPQALDALKMGVVHFLIKPITKDQLQDKVKAIMNKKQK